jgi:transcriptional regulator with XRE-family HTH domain
VNALAKAERNKSWGARCVERRTELGLSQEHVATLAKRSQQTISKIEGDEIIARFSTMEAVARALGTSVEALFPYSSFEVTKRLVEANRKRVNR